LHGSDLSPIVGRIAVVGVAIGQPENVRSAKIGIAGTAALGDFDEAERDAFAYGRSDCMAVNAKFLKLPEGDRQSPVFLPAMVAMLDLDSVEHTPSRQA
jgi:hypothetical protein